MIQEAHWEQARSEAHGFWKKLPSETIVIGSCVDRTLATDALALVDLPTFPTSAMDGYAVCGKGPWNIVGEVKAGAPMKGALKDKSAVKIATGAVIPENTYGIIRWESATLDGDILSGDIKEGQEIRPAGLESKKGEVLASAGTILNPGLIGLLAAAGHDSLEVVRIPRATIILLGDEIVLEGLPHDGLVRDALGPQLPGWLNKLGVEVIATQYVSDELELVSNAFAEAAKNSDIVFTTAGTADGPRDHVRAAIAALKGELIIDRVKVRPGHPMVLAHVNKIPFVGLPGNPQSAIVALLTLGQPVIDALMGRKEAELDQIVTGDNIDVSEGFTRLVLGNVVDGWFEMGEYLGSAMLRGLAHSTGFAVADKSMEEGEMVAWLPLP
jgi:molybdopterin molybdotransferase